MESFEIDPEFPGARIWRRPARSVLRFLPGAAMIVFVVYIAGRMAAVILPGMHRDPLFSAILFGILAVMPLTAALFARFYWRAYQGSRELAIRLTRNAIELTLPANRSLSQPSPAHNGAIPLTDVRAIETRLELFSQLGAKTLMRTYRLVPRVGEPIFLFDEALPAENPNGSQAKGLVEEIAGHAHLALSDLGMVQSKAGFMGIGRARPAAWSTASFNTAEQKMTWTKVNRTAKLMPYVIFGLIALRVLIRMFGHHS